MKDPEATKGEHLPQVLFRGFSAPKETLQYHRAIRRAAFPSVWMLPASVVLLALLAPGCRRQSNNPPGSPLERGQPTHPTTLLTRGPSLAQPPRAPARFTLLFSADVSGETEPCGCAVEPLGGLARQASVVAKARGQMPKPDAVLYLDAGNLFGPVPENVRDVKAVKNVKGVKPGGSLARPLSVSQARQRAEAVALATAHMGLAGFLPGPGDWSLNAGTFQHLLDSAGLVAVASNARSREGDREREDEALRRGPAPASASASASAWQPDLLVTAGAIKVGVMGLVQPRAQDAAELKRWDVAFDAPELVANQRVASLRRRGADVVIVLLNVGRLPAARALLRGVHGIDFAIAAGMGTRLDPPEQVGDTVLLAAMPLGREMGWVDVEVGAPGEPFADRRSRERLGARLADHEKQQQDLERDLVPNNEIAAQHHRAALARIVAEERAALARPAQPRTNTFDAKLIALDPSWADEPFVADLVARVSSASAARSPHRLHTASRPAPGPGPK